MAKVPLLSIYSDNPIGFVSGTVKLKGVGENKDIIASDAVITSTTTPFLSMSGSDGSYTIVNLRGPAGFVAYSKIEEATGITFLNVQSASDITAGDTTLKDADGSDILGADGKPIQIPAPVEGDLPIAAASPTGFNLLSFSGVDIMIFKADSDNDGIVNEEDNCPGIANADQKDTDGDKMGDACQDDDGDGIFNAADLCPSLNTAVNSDIDVDGVGDACDDSDSDGVVDLADNCVSEANENQADLDGDGIGDVCDDSDITNGATAADGIKDNADNCPTVANADQADADGDGIGDVCDDDWDNDDVANAADNCPGTPNPAIEGTQNDFDGDGIGDECDPDDDGDSLDDAVDACPFNATNLDILDANGEVVNACPNGDPDYDGFINEKDNCDSLANADQMDTDGDGQGDACDTNDDGDGEADGSDVCPKDKYDQCPANDADGDLVYGSADNCPDVANPVNPKTGVQTDTDSDGSGDACDTDDDGDGTLDAADSCPLDKDDACPTGDNGDADGDGVTNILDNCPKAANPDQVNTDSDQSGDACDDDIDGDGIANADDVCPLNADQKCAANDPDRDEDYGSADNCPNIANADQTDTDSDGSGNACDSNDDGDANDDSADVCPLDNTDSCAANDIDEDSVFTKCTAQKTTACNDNCPNIANAQQADLDGDKLGDICDEDIDGDGIANADDKCPVNADDSCAAGDIDGDGKANADDNCPNVANADQTDTDGDKVGDLCDDDDDGDGVADTEDPCPLNDPDSCGAGDLDNDGVTNAVDNCLLVSNSDQANNDGDANGGDVCDTDDDNDSIADTNDICPLKADDKCAQNDKDSDGIYDTLTGLTACSGGKTTGCVDNCPKDANPGQIDTNSDAEGDACDTDDDGDSILDTEDNCPLDATDSCPGGDKDLDGIANANDNCELVKNSDQANADGDDLGDACDDDIDGDGTANSDDVCPALVNETCPANDTDGDGIYDTEQHEYTMDSDGNTTIATSGNGKFNDNCINDANPDQSDNDGDGIGDACDVDDDGDGLADTADPCPLDKTNLCNGNNKDGDSIPDDGQANNCKCTSSTDVNGVSSVTCTVGDLTAVPITCNDNCPSVINDNQQDTDSDGIGDICDDSDGDGIVDAMDNCPTAANGDQIDTDKDGSGDACDADDDADTVADASDNCSLLVNTSQDDNDNDKIGDLCDSDDDNDGIEDFNDNCPLVSNNDQSNTGGGVRGDACDDRDADGLVDAKDNCPNVANADQTDSNGNGQGDACEPSDPNDPRANFDFESCNLNFWSVVGNVQVYTDGGGKENRGQHGQIFPGQQEKCYLYLTNATVEGAEPLDKKTSFAARKVTIPESGVTRMKVTLAAYSQAHPAGMGDVFMISAAENEAVTILYSINTADQKLLGSRREIGNQPKTKDSDTPHVYEIKLDKNVLIVDIAQLAGKTVDLKFAVSDTDSEKYDTVVAIDNIQFDGGDVTAPVPGGNVAISGFGSGKATVSWVAATDDESDAASLQYKLVTAKSTDLSADLSGTIDTIEEMEQLTSDAVVMDWTANTSSSEVTIANQTKAYFNVLVKDAAGNIAAYKPFGAFAQEGLAAFFPFNGNANDATVNAVNGTINGDLQKANDRFGNLDGAYLFNGNGPSYIKLPKFAFFDANTGAYTISAWVNMKTTDSSWPRIVDFGDGSPNKNTIFAWGPGNGGQMLIENYLEASYATTRKVFTSERFPLNQWVHVLAVNDGNGTAKIFWNGLEKAAGPINDAQELSDNANFYIGKSNWNENTSAGYYDDIKFFSKALTIQEIVELYNAEKTANMTKAEVPVSTVVSLYQHCDFGGYEAKLPVGNIKYADLGKYGIRNDDISAIRVKPGYVATIYEHDIGNGRSLRFDGDIAKSKEHSCFVYIGFNDILSSVKVEDKSAAGYVAPDTGPHAQVYQHCGYGGYVANLPLGEYDMSSFGRLGIRNDDLSSVKVDPGYQIELYEHAGFGGWKITYDGDSNSSESCFYRWPIYHYNDTISSIKVIKKASGGSKVVDNGPKVSLFQHCNYGGYEVKLAVGDYDFEKIGNVGIRNDDISAIRVSSGYTAYVCQHYIYGGSRPTGTCLTYNGDNAPSSANPKEYACFVYNGFNDQLSSVKVVKN